MASPRSLSATILLKMRRCASRKKSCASISSAAWLNASLWIRMAPSTDFSASRLCGSVRSGAVAVSVSAMGGRDEDKAKRRERRQPSTPYFFRDRDQRAATGLRALRDDPDAQLRGDVAVDLHRDRRLAERLERLGHRDLALVDVEALVLERLCDVLRGDRPIQRVVLADPARD